MIRLSILLPLVCVWLSLSTAVQSQSPVELARQIDLFVEESAIGPLASICNDTDFLRRVTLDLAGVIPDAERARAFLMDNAPDKRQREIERLLASPEFNRAMTLQLSVSLLERRTEKNIPLRNWERFLYESLESDKPLDQLMSELIYAEPVTEQHPANKFMLCREVEPNAVTRDIGRLAFGMDLQCAQCHNHPLIESYRQEDYYGLYAFLHRTTLFTQPSTKLVKLSEKPDGEASFRSVFTGAARDHTTPRLPKEHSLLEEPLLIGEQLYKEKPGKETSGVPAHSRRQSLARMLGASRQFQRNMANRLWALMFARGIVHPLDFHHRDNAPANPRLLEALTDALVSHKFKIRPVLAGIAMSRCYQRSCEPPHADAINFADIAARHTMLENKLSTLQSTKEALTTAANQADTAYSEMLARHDAHAVELAKAVKEVSDASNKVSKADEAFQKADAPFKKSQAQSIALNDAAEKLNAAVALMGDDKQLVDISTNISAKAKKLAASLPAMEKAALEKQAVLTKARADLEPKQAALAAVQSARVPVESLKQLEKEQIESARRLTEQLYALDEVQRQLAICQLLSEYQGLRQADPGKAAAVWLNIVDLWTVHGQVAPLKALTPEQLTFSALSGTGMLTRHLQDASTQARAIQAKAEARLKAEADAKAKATEKPAAEGKSTIAPEDVGATLPALEQQKLIDVVRNRLDQFASLYGGLPGEDFQATVNQALFFGNGNVVDEWLKAGQNNLTDELSKLEAAEVPERMFLTVMSRLPTDAEKQEVLLSLSAPGVDRPQVLNRWLWALLSSSEFRFNH